MILKLAIGRPLHADQLGSEDGESRVPQRDNGPGVGYGIVETVDLSMLGGCCGRSRELSQQRSAKRDCNCDCGKMSRETSHQHVSLPITESLPPEA
jgi:hypothetical protein